MSSFWCDDPYGHRRQGQNDAERGRIDHDMMRSRYSDDCAREYAIGVEQQEWAERGRAAREEEEAAYERAMDRRRERDRIEEDAAYQDRLDREFDRRCDEAQDRAMQQQEADYYAELERRQRVALVNRWRWARSFRAGARFPGGG